jgi:hypothetical protein
MSTENPIEKLSIIEDFNIQQLPRTTKVKRNLSYYRSESFY